MGGWLDCAQWEKRSRTAPGKGDRCAMKSRRVLSCGERGTGLDHGGGQFSPVGLRDHRAGLMALTSLPLSISVLHRGVPASHRTGFKTASKTRFFALESYLVPFSSIHSYLIGACETMACALSVVGEVRLCEGGIALVELDKMLTPMYPHSNPLGLGGGMRVTRPTASCT